MSMGTIELKDIIEKHRKWLYSEPGGERADLSSADLRYANLSSANLSSADLSYANLRYANLSSANLSSANLSSANLSSADLSYADLSYADLRYANLRSANLSSANLSSADLRSANLSSADLRYSNLRSIKEDFLARLALAKNEIVGLYDALMRGKVEGTSYEGECACFVGTIANIRKEKYQQLGIDLRPEAYSPTERWFLAIRKGDIPQSNVISKLTCEWIEEFSKDNSIVLPLFKIVSNIEAPNLFIEATANL